MDPEKIEPGVAEINEQEQKVESRSYSPESKEPDNYLKWKKKNMHPVPIAVLLIITEELSKHRPRFWRT